MLMYYNLRMDIKKIEELKNKRTELQNKIKRIDDIFLEEKENEEAWPGHSSTRYQTADADYQVLVGMLKSIDEEIVRLSN